MSDPSETGKELEPQTHAEAGVEPSNLFQFALQQLGELQPQNIPSNYESSRARLASDLEAAGLTEQARMAYEEALTEVSEGDISHRHPFTTYDTALGLLNDVARLGGDVDAGLTQVYGLFTRGVEPDAIVNTYKANSLKTSLATGQPWLSLTDTEFSLIDARIIKELLKGDESQVYLTPSLRKNAAQILKDMPTDGVAKASAASTKALAAGAVVAHKLGKTEAAQTFIDQALVVAQVPHMPLVEVMEGVSSPPDTPVMPDENRICVADALYKMGQLKESARLALYSNFRGDKLFMGDSQRRLFAPILAEVMPRLLSEQPDDPEVLAMVQRYLSLTNMTYEWTGGHKDHAKTDPMINKGILRIALILQEQHGYELPAGTAPVVELPKPSED